MSTPNQPQQPSDFWNQQQPTPPGGHDARPVESSETDRAQAQAGQGLTITAFILAGVGLLLMVPFPPVGVLLALSGAFVGYRAMKQNKSNKTALIAMIVSAAVAALNLIMLIAWIAGISQVLQGL